MGRIFMYDNLKFCLKFLLVSFKILVNINYMIILSSQIDKEIEFFKKYKLIFICGPSASWKTFIAKQLKNLLEAE